MLDDKIEKIIFDYIYSNHPLKIKNPTYHLIRPIILTILIILGGSAGIPWIQTGLNAGKLFHSELIGYLVATGVVISFGSTTIWVFLEIEGLLTFNLFILNQYKSKKAQIKNIMIHLICNALGIISTIPTFYISTKFNSHFYYAILATFVSYAYATFGIYEIKEIFIIPFLLKNRAYSSSINAKKYRFSKLIEHNIVLDQLNYSISDPILCNKNFLSKLRIKNINITNNLNIKNYFKFPIIIYFPLVNVLFQWTLTTNALNALTHNFLISHCLTLFVIIPLYGLDLFAVSTMIETLYSTFLNFMQLSNKNKKNIYQYIIVFFATIISFFSSGTNVFVSYQQILNSPLSKLTTLIVSSILISNTILQTIGLSTIILIVYFLCNSLLKSKENKIPIFSRKHQKKLSLLIQAIPDEYFLIYLDKYKNNLMPLLAPSI